MSLFNLTVGSVDVVLGAGPRGHGAAPADTSNTTSSTDSLSVRLVPKLFGASVSRGHAHDNAAAFQPPDACALTLDPNTAHRQIILGDNNRKAVRGAEEQPYARHPDRFEDWFQLLGSEGLTGRCYWEVQWDGRIRVAVTYRGISRRGEIGDCSFGWNEKSWSLECNNDGYCAWHNKTITSLSSHPVDSDRVAVYLDWSAGTVSFYRRSSGTLLHLHTFYSRFTEPLYPGFWVGFNCSMALSGMEEDGEWAPV